ncbi:hypothetical protein [Nonomuraea sp. NPDC049141]
MSDGLWLRYWPYQSFLPRHPEPVEERQPEDGRTPGLIDEAN